MDNPVSMNADRGRPREVLALAVTGALLSAAIYVGVVGYRHFLAHTFVPASRDSAWMSPFSYLLFFLVPALPLALYVRRQTRAQGLRAAVTLSVGLTVFALLLPQTAIHRVAAVVLALGAGVAAARVVGSRPDTWMERIRRFRRGLLAAVLVVGVTSPIYRVWSTRQAYASLAPLADGAAPNVLLIILDTVRAASLSLYGYERSTTPEIDAFAKRGVVFDWAMSASPWTLPSHASMMTGQYVGRLSTGFTQTLDAKEPTLAELFRARGYETVGVIANQHYTAWDSGLARGFLYYSDFPRTLIQMLKSSWYGQTVIANDLYRARSLDDVLKTIRQFKLYVVPKPPGDEHTATGVTSDFLEWQAARPSPPRPYFAFLNYYDAHAPYTPTRQWRNKFSKSPKSKDLYEAEIAYIDSEVGRLLKTLEERGALKNTVVIITADHGEQFGEHKLYGHGNSVYLPLLHVPLVVVSPGQVPAGVRVQRTISLRDLPATIAQLSGLDSTVQLPGTSLVPFWTSDSTAHGSTVLSELYRSDDLTPPTDMRRSRQYALLDDTWHLVWRTTQKPELYAYRGDVPEVANQADSTMGAPLVKAMQDKLTSEITRDTVRTKLKRRSVVSSRSTP
ncbi:MAG: sulfatase [Gemmatimonadaceae bacterium]